MKKRDLPTLLCALVEAGVTHCGAATFVIPGQGELSVGPAELRSFVDEVNGSKGPPRESHPPTPLNARPFPTG